MIQQSTSLTCKDWEHAKTSDDLTGAIQASEVEVVLSIEFAETAQLHLIEGETLCSGSNTHGAGHEFHKVCSTSETCGPYPRDHVGRL